MIVLQYEDLYDYQKEIVDKLSKSKLLLMSVSSGKTYCSMFAYKKYGKGKLLILWTTTRQDNSQN